MGDVRGNSTMSDDLQTIIDSSMTISGEMSSSGTVVLEGRFDGIFSGHDLVIGGGAVISGDIRSTTIDCYGNIEGRVKAANLILRKTAHHTGVAETSALKIEPGAQLDCILQAGDTRKKSVAPPAEAPVVPVLDLQRLAGCFTDNKRPCCMDVPWSERQALYATLLELLAKGKALIKVQGEEGSGKSELYAKLKRSLPTIFRVITIDDVVGSVSELLLRIAQKLGIDIEDQPGQPELLQRMAEAVTALQKQNRRVVWLVDDVQQMYPASLEGVVNILADAFGEGNGLLQMVIFGDHTMQETLVATVLEYFEDETNCQLVLAPLSIKDTADYLRFVLQLRGGEDGPAYVSLFPYETIRTIHARSGGNLASMNELAGQAVRKCLKLGAREITPDMF